MFSEPVDVLYIAGCGRSGSTVLENVMSQIPGFVGIGEVRHIWERGVGENRLCSDGRPFRENAFWTRVLEALGAKVGSFDTTEMARFHRDLAGRRAVIRILFGRSPVADTVLKSPYATVTRALYETIRTQSGCKVIVDSSKSPIYALMLAEQPGIRLRVVHLLRDPRAVAWSWRRLNRSDGKMGGSLPRHSLVRSALQWRFRNATAASLRQLVSSHLSVRYEDFMQRPRAVIRQVAAFAEAGEVPLPFVGERRVLLKPNHSMSGNPSRFLTGEVELQEDDEWQQKLPRYQQMLVMFLTWPLSARWGYAYNLTRSERRIHDAQSSISQKVDN